MSEFTTPRIFIGLSALFVALNAFVFNSWALGAVTGLCFIVSCGFALGGRFLQGVSEPFRSIIGSGAVIALIGIIGSIFYYASFLTTATLVITTSIAALFAIFFSRPRTQNLKPRTFPQPTILDLLTLLGIISLIAWWTAVLLHPVTESVRSPWLIMSPFALLALFLPVIFSVILFWKGKTISGYVLFSLTLFSGLAMAAAMYPLGYGFDPFLHRTTVEYIAEFGTITPKPLYYIGQYAIELFAVKLLHLPLFITDVYLAPTLAAFLLPAAILSSKKSESIMLMLVLLPLAAFVETTPQALSFLFTGVVIFLTAPALIKNESTHGSTATVIPAIFALAAFLAHPLSGALAIAYLVFIAAAKSKIALAVTFIAMSLTLPCAFAFQSWHAHLPLGLSWPTVSNIFSLPLSLYLGTSFNAWGDIAYFIAGNMFIGIIVLSIIVLIRLFKTPESRTLQQFVPFFAALAAFLNFLFLTLFFNFNYLISYERTDFALRALTLVALFLLPYVVYVTRTDKTPLTHGSIARAILPASVLTALIFCTNVYAAYPRDDGYVRSAGFNVQQSDIEAALSIDSDAAGKDYVVLSNQAVAAAAVETLGFKKYYPGDIFFYPIPTGGELYQLFLSMSENPTLETIQKVRTLTGASTIYFVVNNYWWKSDWIIENTKNIASTWFSLQNGSTTVFIFTSPE